MQFNPAIAQPGHDRIMRNHDDSASLLVQLPQQSQHDLFVDSIQIAGGFVGEHDFRVIDQSAGDAYPLLLTTGKLRRNMVGTLSQAHLF